MIKSRALTVVAGLCGILAYTAGPIGVAQVVAGQAVDANGAPQYIVDPFWPKPAAEPVEYAAGYGHVCRSHGSCLVH